MPPPLDALKSDANRMDSHEMLDMTTDQTVKECMQSDMTLISNQP